MLVGVYVEESDAKSPPCFAGITAKLLQVGHGETKTAKDKEPSSVTAARSSCVTFSFIVVFRLAQIRDKTCVFFMAFIPFLKREKQHGHMRHTHRC